jgi:hypothetical protein
MCLAIDIILRVGLYHWLDVYGFNILNYFGSLGWLNQGRSEMENTI